MFKRLLAGINRRWMNGERSNDARREQLSMIIDEQNRLLNHQCILASPNRQGLREKTGALLETAFIDLAANLVPTLSVEIGAHEASFSERLKAKCPTLHAVAFEASPRVFDLHATRLKLPAVGVDYRHIAISDEDGFAELRMPLGPDGAALNPGISSLLHRANFAYGYEEVRVPALTLDSALAQLGTERSVAWIDVEGAQHKIIAGGRRYFTQVAAVYIEIERVEVWKQQWIDTELAKVLAGFSLVPVMRDNLAKSQFNEVYIRADNDIMEWALAAASRYKADLENMIAAADVDSPELPTRT
jgi:FkbM family methyltransferase